MNGDHSLIVSSKQQKSLRLDAFATKLAEDNPAKISANGYVDNSLENGTVKMLEAKIETRMCIECGSGFLGGGAAEVCDTCSGVGGAMQMGVGLVCPLCSGLVLNHNAARVCTSCKKFVHRECDRSDVNMTEFVCASCRRSPLVGDIMLSAAIGPASPLGAESDSITVPSSTSVSDLTLNPFRSSSPVTTGAVVPDFNVDVYNMSEGISSPATTSDSARNSPFYPENSPSDVDEDFVPGSSRGGYTSRGRGGAKKKPGRGSSSKTRGAKPPSGDPSIFPPSTRGKRGKRGLKVNGIGKAPGTGRGRGRGRGANSQLQQSAVLQQIIMQQQQQQQLQLHQQQPQMREVDETMLGEDDDRNVRADDVEYVRTAIICDAQDQYMQQSSICLVCGAVGKPHTQESSMVACCNCAQTFHTYCVGLHDKLNQAVVNRGWRCLDCTICEGCGEGKDESKLLLCEECDVSFHIYCLSPPLDRIPNGPWRCQWCARCRRCNVRVTSGTDLSREGLCTTCSSLRKCPKCSKLYNIGEKIIKCSACARWYHGTCEDLYNDEMLESASANKMRCSACRPNSRTTSALMGLSDHSSLLICDNVALNKSAEEVLQSRFMPSLFRPNPVDSFGYRSESFDHYGTEDDFLQEEIEMLSTSTRGRGMGRGGGPGRRVPKLGVGGFFVKIPRHRLLTMEDDLPDEDGNKKQKRPRKPRRSQLEDAYPPAIQEGFFGMRPVEGKALIDAVVEEPSLAEYGKGRTTTAIEAVGRGHELSHEATEQLKNDLTEVDILENLDIGEVDLDNMDMDFTNWMEDDEDDDFDDSLNDAFDIVKADGFEPSTNSDLASTPVSSVPTGPTTFPNDVTNITPAPATPAYLMANKAKSLSRSSSQMDGVEKNNPTTERWEEDEPLGSQATKAAVLYANERHAYLKEKYPDWNDRVKHIQRLWRVLDTENRQDFVSRARENRANRGKQPRVKRVVYKHAAAAADERFKVPNVPGGSQMRSDFYHSEMGGQVPQEVPVQQIRSTAHLTQPVLEQYELMRTRTLDLQKHQQVYECLDDVVSRVSMHFDGRDPAREGSGMLKRLLEPAMGQQMPPMGPGPQGPPSHLMDQLEPPRPKKKRAQQKKFESVGMGNEYDLMVERVNTQLRLCEQLPKRAMEPAPRNPGAAFATMGISDLPDRRDKRALIGKEFGHLSLSFVDDYYTGKGRDTECLEMTSLSMSDLAPQANLPALTNIPPPPLYEMVVDAEDAAFGSFDQWAVFANSLDRQPCANHMRVASKIPEFTIPLEPRRKVFSMKPDTVEEVEVSLVVKEETSVPPGTGVAALFEQLRSILGVEQLIEYQLDTPPLSPEPSTKSESVDNIKREPPDVTQTPVSGGGRCRACDRSMEAVLIQQTMSQLGLTPSDDEKDDTVCFCSMKCYYQFVAASKVALSPDQLTAAESHVDEETLAKLRQISAESFAKCINQGKMRMDLPAAPAVPPDAFLTSPRDTRYVMDEGRRDNVQIIRVADLATIQDAAQRKDTTRSPGDDWKAYSRELLHSFFKIQQTKQELALSPKMGVGLGTSFELDRRVCVLCGGIGDGDPALCGRLLNLSANLWVHVNCAMWSTEVFETTSGALLHVDRAVVRAAGVICHLCGRVGASVQCHKVDCNVNFHLPCAAKIQTAKFVKDKTFFCTKHPEISPEVMVTSLEALRRIYIERDENAFLSRLFDYSDSCSRLCLRIGALCFFQVGQLLPDQLKTFHNATHIFPNGYHVSRWFWSPTDPRKREIYDCHIKDVDHRPKFVVSYADHTYEGDSATEAWSQVVNSVERIRSQSDALRFLAKGITGETLFGLNESVISKITESLPGVDGLFTYTFRHPNSPLLDLPLAVNPSGCARCEPRFRTLIKHKQRALASAPSTSRSTQDGGSSSSGRTRGRIAASFTDELAAAQMRAMLQASGIGSEWALALGGREPFSSNSQSYTLYQKMRKDWRQTVYLARSKIQGLGLYAKRDIHMGDMIIEYKGEVIRSEVGEMREKRYVAQNRGVYMFRIDEDLLVDATMAGGPARYINHSCDPNCSTRILAAGPYPEDKKIIITANRPIKALEELTYDYQFELEDTTDKIPCLCGAPNCVKWMN
nr:Zinc finger and FY-rich and SET domain containing protein [Haemonchus contortus]